MGFTLPFFTKKKAPTLYFGLYITDASLFGFIFDTKLGTNIVASHAVSLTAGFDKLLEDTDNVISELELKSSLHLDRTIFFLHSWMIDEQSYEIKEPYKTIVKQLSKDLELDPMGYIDVQEALHEHLQRMSILNTIAVEVNKTKLGIFVYKGGKKVYSQYTARTDTVGEDVQAVLQAIPGSIVLPTKLLVFGDIDTAIVASELASYEWLDKTFTQHPSIEIVKQHELNEALASIFTEEVVSQTKVPSPDDSSPVVQEPAPLKEIPGENFGFVVGQDIAEVAPTPAIPTVVMPQTPVMQEEIIDNVPPQNKSNPLVRFFSRFGTLKGRGMTKPLFIGVAVAVVLFILLFIYEYFFHKMDVTVYLNAESISEELDVTAPVSDTETSEFAAVRRTTVQTFEDEKKTTGTREEGEKATGDVIINNYTKEPRTFARGTELRKGGLVFLTDSEVKVASASGGTVDKPSIDPGKATVKVTASEIGPDYNIGKGSELTVASLSDTFKAFADTAFTGGSKKEVKTVSKADRDILAKNVSDKADEGSAEVLGASVTSEDIVLPELTEVDVSETEYSGEIGEEASTLKVTAESEISFVTIQKSALTKQLVELLQKDLSDNKEVNAESIEFEITDVSDDDDVIEITVDVNGKAVQKVEDSALQKASKFTSHSSLSRKLTETFDVSRVEYTKAPALSFWTPLFAKNITITTVSE